MDAKKSRFTINSSAGTEQTPQTIKVLQNILKDEQPQRNKSPAPPTKSAPRGGALNSKRVAPLIKG
jgi:hypothetical protein